MTSDRRRAFQSAFEEWQAKPIAVLDENAFLYHSSTSLVGIQEDIAPTMIKLYETGEPLPDPMERWNDGMNYLIVRQTDVLRRHLRRGRNQVSTRALIEDALRLQRAWDAYLKLIGA